MADRPNRPEPEKEYQRRNPGAGGPPSMQQDRAKTRPKVTSNPDEAAIPGGSHDDLKRDRRRPRRVS
jgi:hypothetical protein